MKKNLILKFCTISLIVTVLSPFILTITSQATKVEETKISETSAISLEPDEKIMKYNAITNETTEVNIEELRQKFSNNSKNINRNNAYTTSSCNEYLQKKLPRASNIKLNLPRTSNDLQVAASDNMSKVSNTSNLPNIATCKTISKYRNTNYISNGTATIIAPHVALTAAHCIWDMYDNDYKFTDWVVYPGCNDGFYYGTKCGWVQVYYSSKWFETHSYKYDWAICELGYNVGNEVGWVQVTCYPNNVGLLARNVTNLGYIESGLDQYESKGRVISVFTDDYRTSASSVPGFSGGPILNSDNNLIGIIHGTDNLGQTIGVRITEDLIYLIKEVTGL